MHLLVSELRRFHNARCNDENSLYDIQLGCRISIQSSITTCDYVHDKNHEFLCSHKLKTSNISEVGSASVFRRKLVAPAQIDSLDIATHTLMFG